MDQQHLKKLLEEISSGELAVDDGLARLRHFPFEDVGIARIDHHRELRQGTPEVIFGENKTSEQLLTIVTAMAERKRNILITRIASEKAAILSDRWPQAEHDPLARTLCLRQSESSNQHRGPLLIACAGTSDLPVAREALVTARMLDLQVEELVDVGVAGIHRLLAETELLSRAAAIIVVAGMEGALPSVIGGLVAVPVIAVPTSVGYGTAFGGVAALLGMLNSCASGVTVVNIDNGFGAAFAAARMLRLESV